MPSDGNIYRAWVKGTATETLHNDKFDAYKSAYEMALDFANGDQSMMDIHDVGMRGNDGLVIIGKREIDLLLGGTEIEKQQFCVAELPVQ